ncbi:MAG: hypothetical protein K6F56_05980 [Oscillospiraceae bacterium]|nr:hypothetical protein [Oscillospiraceae bacterium]
MAERYTRLFSLPQDLYTPGAPLVIAAGALLKDSQTGSVLAQLKLRSLSDVTISAVKLQVVGYDMAKAEVCREEHQYLDLRVKRDESFGAKEAIPLPVRSVRSFSVQVLAVFFSDGGSYTGTDAVWLPLPEQADLNAQLFDAELIRQYRLETSEKSRFVPQTVADLWMCTCGELNHSGEPCHRCALTLEEAQRLLDVDLLRTKKTARLEEEALRQAEEDRKKNSRGYRLRRLALFMIPVLLIAGAAAGTYHYAQKRAAAYDRAAALYESGDYAEAAAAFDRLGNYQDAAERASAARAADSELNSYVRAGKLLENGRYEDAAELYQSLGDYRDSAELVTECGYRKALELLDEGAVEQARELFAALGGYKDSAQRAAHFFERLLSEEESQREDAGGPLTTVYAYDAKGVLVSKTELYSAYEKEDRVFTYAWGEDGSCSVTENQVEKRYDAYGSYLGQGGHTAYVYEYGFKDDGSLNWCVANDPDTGDYLSSVAYDAYGNPSEINAEDGTKTTIRSEYQDGRLVKQERYDEAGNMLDRTSFEYDEQGRLKRKVFIVPGDATSAVTTSYTYGLLYLPEAES